jgi:uncharacterized damage-inducible protein DinB
MLKELTADVASADAATPPAAGEWGVIDVVRHLVEGDRDKFLPRLRRILVEAQPVFAKVDATPGDASDLPTLVAAYASARAQVVRILSRLEPAEWSRTGVTPSRGPLSIDAYARSTRKHDTEHLGQIQAIRAALGLRPKRCEARQALSVPALAEALAPSADRLAATAAGLDDAQRRRRPAAGEWGVNEIMAHLLHVETELFLPRLRRIVAEDQPAFTAFTPEPWARERDHSADPFAAPHAAFVRARAETVAFLRALPEGAGERLGVSGFFGPISLLQYATHIADHDIEHLRQMQACARAVTPRS